MELYLDASGVDAVKALARILPLVGMTTSLSIVTAGSQTLKILLPQLQETMGGQGRLFVQMTATTAEGMVDDARRLRAIIADIVVRVSMIAEGLTAVKLLKEKGIPTLGTAIYGATQGLLTTLAGAGYAAPYVNCVDTQGGDDIQTMTDLQTLLKMHAPHAKILATSFRTPCRVLDCLLAGCGSIALPLGVAQQMISSPAVGATATKLEHDWQSAFDRTSI